MKRVIRNSMTLLLTTCLLSGCWNRKEINDIAIVLTTAFDAAPNGAFRECIEVPLTGQLGGATGGGGGTSGDKVYYANGADGLTIREASNKLQRGMSRSLFYAHRRVMLIGEELAKKGMSDVLDIVVRIPKNRMSALVAITKGDACHIINADTKLERFTGEAIREMITMQSALPSTLKDASITLASKGKEAVLPYLELRPIEGTEKKEFEVSFSGYTYFQADRMVGVVKGKQSTGMIWLLNRFKPYTETVPYKDGYVSLMVNSGSVKIHPVFQQDRLSYNVKVHAVATIEENVSSAPFDKLNNIDTLTEALQKQIKMNIEETLKLLQKKKSDAIGAGDLLYWNYPKKWLNHYQHDWKDHFASLPFHVTATAEIAKVGMISDNITRKEQIP